MQLLQIFIFSNSVNWSKLPQKAQAGAYLRRTIRSPSTKISRESLPREICKESQRSGGRTNRPAKSTFLIIPVAFIIDPGKPLSFSICFFHSTRFSVFCQSFSGQRESDGKYIPPLRERRFMIYPRALNSCSNQLIIVRKKSRIIAKSSRIGLVSSGSFSSGFVWMI